MSLSHLQVQWAETGQIVDTTVDGDNCSLEIFKCQLSKLVPVAPLDQILLIGPPYKVLDKQYGPSLLHRQSAEKDRRLIFLYDKRVINDDKKLPPTFQLPAAIALTDLAAAPLSSSALDALRCYDGSEGEEDRATALLWCGQFVAEQRRRAGQLAAACGDCERWVALSLEQQRGQLGGMEAAVSNLRDIFAAHQREFLRVKHKFEQQQAGHLDLIVNFESNLNKLRHIDVSAPLREAMDRAAATAAAAEDAASPSNIHTLYDCIPAERERAYLHLCADTHYKVEETGRRIHSFFDDILGRVAALQVPAAEAAEQASRACLDVLRDTTLRLAAAEADLHALQERVGDALTQANSSSSSSSSSSSGSAAIASSRWEEIRAAVAQHIQAQLAGTRSGAGDADRDGSEEGAACANMTTAATLIIAKAQEVCSVQTQLARESYRLLRLVGGLQTEVAHKLKKDIDWMRRWTSSHNEYFSHLEHIADLPQMYSQVLQEIARRNHYNKVFEGEVCFATERIAGLRDAETKQREAFMRQCGQHLPPIFFQAIPSLKEKPPFFSPTLSDAQPLPDMKIDGLLQLRDKASSAPSAWRASEEEALSNPSSAGRRGRANSGSLVSVSGLGLAATTAQEAAGEGRGLGLGLGRAATMSTADEVSFRFNQLAYEHAVALGDVDSARRENEALRRQLDAKEEIITQLRRQGDRRERGLSLELYGSTYPAERLLCEKAASASTRSVEVQAGQQQQQEEEEGSLLQDAAAEVEAGTGTGAGTGAEPEQAAVAAESVSAVDGSDDSPAATSSLLPAEEEGVGRSGAVEVVQETQAPPSAPFPLFPPLPPAPLLLPAVPVEQLMAVFLVLRDMLTMDKDVQDFFMNNAAAVEADLPVAPQGLLLSALGHRSEADEEGAGDPHPDPDPQMSALWTLASEVAVSVARVSRGLMVSVRAPKISFKDFRVGDIMLFIPTSEARKKWLAFHTGAPHRYLSDESVESFRPRGRGGEPRASLLGKVVMIDTFTASADMNPYGLPLGTEFYVCSAHPVTKDMIASPSAAAALALSSSAMQASFSSSSITATADTARAAVNYKGPSS